MKTIYLLTTALVLAATPAMAAMGKDDPEMMKKKADYWFDKIDSNHDGFISMDEHKAAGDMMWKSADANADGKISREECLSAKQKEHDEMKNNMMNTNETKDRKDR